MIVVFLCFLSMQSDWSHDLACDFKRNLKVHDMVGRTLVWVGMYLRYADVIWLVFFVFHLLLIINIYVVKCVASTTPQTSTEYQFGN